MAQPIPRLRADAARNRARVLEVAYETFAAEGLSVPIDEIARRADVGAGTVYRHFPPGEALFTFLLSMVLQWGAADRGLVDALAGLGIDINTSVPEAEEAFLGLLGEMLSAAQESGTARKDVGVPEVKALLVGCQAVETYNSDLAGQVTNIALDGLRPAASR